jgi:hypothetical protein
MSHPGAGKPDGPTGEEPNAHAALPLTASYQPPLGGDAAPSLHDEILGEDLDRFIDGLQNAAGAPPGGAPSNPEQARLTAVLARVSELDCYLAAEVVGVADAGPGSEQPGTALQQVGKYRLGERLGVGGQAMTYKAWDPDLQRHVVIKLYHVARTAAEQERVLREGQALARVRSPHVAQVHSVERHAGLPYLVIEYIPGRSLTELHHHQPLDVARALAVTAQVAEGLAAVHARGLLHRDLKPGNILVGDDGVPRLVDFGLAKPLGDEGLQEVSGTLAYMPPEQARGDLDRIDPRTDLFGLGAVLYFLLTGGPPYRAATQAELWEAARAGDVVPAVERNPDLPAAVNALCMRCLEKDPTRRFASAAELMEAIRRCQAAGSLPGGGAQTTGTQPPGTPRRPQGRSRLLIGAAALVLLATAAGWLYHASRRADGGRVAPDVPRDLDGRALRQDFPFTVEFLGTRKEPTASLHHITEGQLLSFRLESSVNCYVGIWYTNEEGKVTQLFPNDHDLNHLLIAGKPRLIPGENDYVIRAAPAKGPGRMHVLASTERWDPLKGRKAGPYVVFATPEELEGFRNFELAAKTRAVSESVCQIQVDPR